MSSWTLLRSAGLLLYLLRRVCRSPIFCRQSAGRIPIRRSAPRVQGHVPMCPLALMMVVAAPMCLLVPTMVVAACICLLVLMMVVAACMRLRSMRPNAAPMRLLVSTRTAVNVLLVCRTISTICPRPTSRSLSEVWPGCRLVLVWARAEARPPVDTKPNRTHRVARFNGPFAHKETRRALQDTAVFVTTRGAVLLRIRGAGLMYFRPP